MDFIARVDVNCGRKDGRTDGRTENRTPISHFAKAGATKRVGVLFLGFVGSHFKFFIWCFIFFLYTFLFDRVADTRQNSVDHEI